MVLSFLERQGLGEASVGFPFMLALAHYAWPYNVRELESAVRVAVTLSDGAPLDLLHLPEAVRRAWTATGHRRRSSGRGGRGRGDDVSQRAGRRGGSVVQPDDPWRYAERGAAARAAARHHGNIAAVGRELGKERMQVHRWLRRYSLDVEQFRR